MKVLLLNAPPLKEQGIVGQIYPPLGILYLAAYARQNMPDLDIKIIDGYKTDRRQIISFIQKFKPDLLGVTFTTQASTGAYSLINEVKDINSKLIIVCGGPHSTLMPEEVLNNSKTDYVVIGEGEITFHELLTKFDSSDIESIKGIAYRSNGQVKINEPRGLISNLDIIPFPARDLIDLKLYPGYHYKKQARDISLLSSRGCPYQCVFCSNPIWKLQKPWFRTRSPENVIQEIQEITEKYKIYEYYDQADEFNPSLKHAKDFCDKLIDSGLEVTWKTQLRPDRIDEELSYKMAQSGCWLGILGIETGNDETLKGIGKRFTTKDVETSLRHLKKNGVKTFALLMAFNVWEDAGKLCFEGKAETLQTLKFARKLSSNKLIDLMSWSVTTPYPGSALYDIAKKYDLIDNNIDGDWENWDSSANMVIKLPGITEATWKSIYRRAKFFQALLLIRSGTFNLKSIPIYLKKLILVTKKIVFTS